MSLDLLDAAFVQRLAVGPHRAPAPAVPRPARRPPIAAATVPPALHRSAAEAPVPPVAVPAAAGCTAAGSGVARGARAPSVPEHEVSERATAEHAVPQHPVVRHPVVERPVFEHPAVDHRMAERLLALAPDQWQALADAVEAARQRGRRVIAVAGSRAGEGRTTLIRCLAATLQSRGREVRCVEPHELAVAGGGADGPGPTHDKRIVLVDAGIWFPPGPIRRSVVQVASLGCEAAILVRRSGASGGLARQAALESLGVEVLGEVLTFSRALADAESAHGGAVA